MGLVRKEKCLIGILCDLSHSPLKDDKTDYISLIHKVNDYFESAFMCPIRCYEYPFYEGRSSNMLELYYIIAIPDGEWENVPAILREGFSSVGGLPLQRVRKYYI